MSFSNEFSWSAKKDKTFKTCQRKYYFDCYGYFNGWFPESPQKAKDLYQLKKLKSIPLWVGGLVRDNIRKILETIKEGKKPTLEQALIDLETKFEEELKQSENEEYKKDIKRFLRLQEHDYGLFIQEDDLKQKLEFAKNYLKNFYESKLFEEIKKTDPNLWILRNKSHFPHFFFEGTKVYCMYDLAIPKNDLLTVYDWTTGSESDENEEVDRKDMLLLYFSKKRTVDCNKFSVKRIFLKNNFVELTTFNSTDLIKTENYMHKSIEGMKCLLDDKIANTTSEQNYKKTDIEGNCKFCNFKKHCLPDSPSEFRGYE